MREREGDNLINETKEAIEALKAVVKKVLHTHTRTFSMASNASERNVPTEANHCSVARKIVGFLVRQS